MADALTLNATTALPNFLAKWQALQPYAATLPPVAGHSIFNYDLQKLKAGQQPISQDEAQMAMQSAADLQTHLPQEHPKGLLGLVESAPSAFMADATKMLTNIPHMPGQLISEIGALPQAPAAISQAISDRSLSDLARAPGLRDLPGSYTLANLAHPTELLKHPGITAMDLAPYTAEGAKFLPEEFKAAVREPIVKTLDRFGVGPTAVGVTRTVNVAQREAAAAARQISESASALAKGLNPEERLQLQSALTGQPHASPTLPGQMELPGVGSPVTADFSPALMEKLSLVKDAQAHLDVLRKASRQGAVATIANSYGHSLSELMAEHGDAAAKLAAATGADVGDAFKAILRQQGLEEFKPGQLVPGTKAVDAEPIYVPKVVNQTLDRMFNTNIKTGLGKAYDAAMGVFRTAVLPLSLHWHLVHGTGSMAMLAADTGPSILKYIGDAGQMVKEGTLPAEISQIGSGGESRLADLFKTQNPDEVFHLQKGAELGNMLNTPKFAQYAATVGAPLGKVINGSYRVAGMIDQMTGALAYLYGKGKGEAAGLSEEAAHQAGIEQANRVLHDWDGITPVERQVIRSLFPFYAWMKTISKYVFKYPINHPIRASIMANFAKNELQDAKTGIPEEYRNYFMFGHPDAQGNQHAAYINRINPFADVTSIFTLGGLLSQTNPFVGAVAESLGITPKTGAGQAFPHVVYNPLTGKQEAQHQNYISTLLHNFIPQESAVTRLLGLETQQQKDLKLINPESYKNQFWSSLGLPNLRTVNLPKVAGAAEINRYQALSRQFNAIINSGQFDQLRSFHDPRFNAIADRLDALSASGALKPYENTQNGVQQLDAPRVMRLLGL